MLIDINQRLSREIAYVIRMEPGVQEPEETLTLKSGSCRDSAWLMVQILRGLGLAARFVSGYLIQLKADIDPVSGPIGTRHDFTDLHAWAEVYLPGAGWIGLDATSGLLCGEGHIPLAATPHYRAAAPISGALDPCEITFDHTMAVTRVAEAPRISLPFSDEAWAALDALGRQVDADLKAQDVRLTTGGEPTFIVDRRFRGARVERRGRRPDQARLCRQPDPSAAHPLRAGRLPALRPGQVVSWREPAALGLLAVTGARTASRSGAIRTSSPARPGRAPPGSRMPAASCRPSRIGSASNTITCRRAYEDPAHWLLKEAALPREIDALQAPVGTAEQRARIARVFARGLTVPAGFVLPVTRLGRDWASEVWQTRREHIFLTPGDSPVGFRLPLDTLDYIPPSRFPYAAPAGPDRAARAAARPRPADHHHRIARRRGRTRRGRRRTAAPTPRSGPPSRSSRATGSSACSCRRSTAWRTISNS